MVSSFPSTAFVVDDCLAGAEEGLVSLRKEKQTPHQSRVLSGAPAGDEMGRVGRGQIMQRLHEPQEGADFKPNKKH